MRLEVQIKANLRGDRAHDMGALEKLVCEGIFGCGGEDICGYASLAGLRKKLMIRDPLAYLREIADWTGRNESTPMTWGHVLLGSLDVAMAKSPYGKEPLLRMLRDELRERALDRLRRAPDPDLSWLVR